MGGPHRLVGLSQRARSPFATTSVATRSSSPQFGFRAPQGVGPPTQADHPVPRRPQRPPGPGGFGLLKATAASAVTYRGLYQVLRLERTWRWRNTYGWMAKYPIEPYVMRSFVRPVLERADIRFDGRKAIGSVSGRYARDVARRLVRDFDKPVQLVWASEDHVFPLAHATRYSRELGAGLRTVEDSYTYVTEDQPAAVARLLIG